MCILKVYSVHYTLGLNANVKKNFFGLNKRHKNLVLQPKTALILIYDSYMS